MVRNGIYYGPWERYRLWYFLWLIQSRYERQWVNGEFDPGECGSYDYRVYDPILKIEEILLEMEELIA